MNDSAHWSRERLAELAAIAGRDKAILTRHTDGSTWYCTQTTPGTWKPARPATAAELATTPFLAGIQGEVVCACHPAEITALGDRTRTFLHDTGCPAAPAPAAIDGAAAAQLATAILAGTASAAGTLDTALTGRWAAEFLAVLEEPAGLGDEQLPDYETVPAGTCGACHRGPLYRSGRCAYCHSLTGAGLHPCWEHLRPSRIRHPGPAGLIAAGCVLLAEASVMSATAFLGTPGIILVIAGLVLLWTRRPR